MAHCLIVIKKFLKRESSKILEKRASLETVDLFNNACTGSIPAPFCSLNGTEMNVRNMKIKGTVLGEY